MGLPGANAVDMNSGPWAGGWWFGSEAGEGNGTPSRRDGLPMLGEMLREQADEVLLARVARGDAEAFAAFYDRHESLLYSVALRILRVESEAEDVLQEAAVSIWERAPLYRADCGRPISWAITVLRHKAIDRLRSTQRRVDLLERAAEEMATLETSGTGPSEGGGESAILIRKCLTDLPVEQRQAIELAFFGGFSQSEIAERLREPLGTVKARIRRGMLAMRDALEGAL